MTLLNNSERLAILNVVPRNELLIERSYAQTFRQRAEGGVVSMVLAAIHLGGLVCIAWIAWLVSAGYAGQKLHPSFHAPLAQGGVVGLIAVAAIPLLMLLLWAVVQWARFQGVERRTAIARVTIEAQARWAKVDADQLRVCQESRVVELHFEGDSLKKLVGRDAVVLP